MKSGNDSIVWGMLNKLVKENKVKKCPQNPAVAEKMNGWDLTDEEYASRRDDVAAWVVKYIIPNRNTPLNS